MWPDGARWAVSFTFDFDAEEVWIGENSAHTERPGVLSQGTYGARVAIPLILEILHRLGITATFFVPGKVAERHPGRLEEILAGGHEVAHHGYRHIAPAALSRQEEQEELERGLEALRNLGAEVVGYRAPSWDPSAHTLSLLAEAGFLYASQLMDDVRPYRHGGAGVIEIPVHWVLDDAPHFWFDGSTWAKKISTAEEVRAIWEGELRGMRRLGGCAVFTMHPQIIGRPGRLELLEGTIRHVLDHDDVWVATCREIAEAVA